MILMRLSLLPRILTALILSNLYGYAQAQQSGSSSAVIQTLSTFDVGWQIVCRASDNDRTRFSCSLYYESVTEKEKTKLLSLEFFKNDKGRRLTITTPAGIELKGGLELALDNEPRFKVPFSFCRNNNCFANYEISDKFLENIKKGQTLTIVYLDQQGNNLKTDIRLIGFKEAARIGDY